MATETRRICIGLLGEAVGVEVESDRAPASFAAEMMLLVTVGTRRAVQNAWSAARRIVELVVLDGVSVVETE